MSALTDDLTIGDVALRSGLAPSTLRFYEEKGLICSRRTRGNQRRFGRDILRRVAVIKAAQTAGLSLTSIAAALSVLPPDRAPGHQDWQRLSRGWRRELDSRIGELQSLRDRLTGCIGCGCLSLSKCRLFNPGDKAGEQGPGARYLIPGRGEA